eukprot:CAMPEP_0181326880 /NCGR_PEP_ID=MMETSP1101-20121128/21764_1 /TAXON_ID=46948 /ORGANISM="Rhodomonas abbreviata, Strain Caron Lab Isolate" /LENGTH=55 /DNA_ID=CAMNT_0023435423 /DNA_START=23 /DNA_END=190 /DNA_ORIENTATION=+
MLTKIALETGDQITTMLLGRLDPWPDELRGEETNAASTDTIWQCSNSTWRPPSDT